VNDDEAPGRVHFFVNDAVAAVVSPGMTTAGTRAVRTSVSTIALLLLMGVGAVPAAAGGTWLEFEQDTYAAGETAVAMAQVFQGAFGWVEDGPFQAYLAPADDFGCPTDHHLGELDVGAPSRGAVHVTLAFVVPDVAPGRYSVVICNRGSRTGLGDLIGGEVTVVAGRLPYTGAPYAPFLALAIGSLVVGAFLVTYRPPVTR
jgi:hypothetical protein